MTITIPDDIARRGGVTERDVLVELACKLYNADRIQKAEATRMTGLSRAEFEAELTSRGLPWIRVRDDDALADIERARSTPREGER
jgi:predicted HTH domain antitoxin